MKIATVISTTVLVAALAVSLQAQKEKPPTVTGKWTMSVKGTPHGDTTMGLSLQQEGQKVKGTFASPHGDHPLEGKFTDGTLEIATMGAGHDAPQVTFTAKLKEDDTLAGNLSSPMGDMTWTATRVKASK
jgi:phage gp45-like